MHKSSYGETILRQNHLIRRDVLMCIRWCGGAGGRQRGDRGALADVQQQRARVVGGADGRGAGAYTRPPSSST